MILFLSSVATPSLGLQKGLHKETLLKCENGEISVLVYRNATHTDQYITAVLTMKQVAREALFPPCLLEHIPLSQMKMISTKKTQE